MEKSFKGFFFFYVPIFSPEWEVFGKNFDEYLFFLP